MRCTRNICKSPESFVDFKLARKNSTGLSVDTRFSLLKHSHLITSLGPCPVSIVEIQPSRTSKVPLDTISILHSLSLGFPVVGETQYLNYEKFYNPVAAPPEDKFQLMLRSWMDSDGQVLESPLWIGDILPEFEGTRWPFKSKLLHSYNINEFSFDGEVSACEYSNHPGSVAIRRDRGRAT